MLRQGAGLTTLQTLFDNLDQSQKILGGIMLDLMQTNWTPGKIQRITNEEPTEQFYNRAFGKYDAVVEEGLNTSTQKQLQFGQMLELRQVLGDLISPEDLLESATIQNKEELIKKIKERNESAQQQQQQQQQVQMEVLGAQIKDLQARAVANEGLGAERASRIQENRALAIERLAEAQKDRDLGTLDRVKAIKELTDIDLNQVAKALEIIGVIQEQKRMEEESEEVSSGAQGTQEVPGQL
jgi:hypothetical protein